MHPPRHHAVPRISRLVGIPGRARRDDDFRRRRLRRPNESTNGRRWRSVPEFQTAAMTRRFIYTINIFFVYISCNGRNAYNITIYSSTLIFISSEDQPMTVSILLCHTLWLCNDTAIVALLYNNVCTILIFIINIHNLNISYVDIIAIAEFSDFPSRVILSS